MVSGQVRIRLNADGDPIPEVFVPLLVKGFNGQEINVETILDTGFCGSLSLRQSDIDALGLLPSFQILTILADGSLRTVATYTAIVEWDGIDQIVETLGDDQHPLLGMGLLLNRNVSMNVVGGGVVQITRLN